MQLAENRATKAMILKIKTEFFVQLIPGTRKTFNSS